MNVTMLRAGRVAKRLGILLLTIACVTGAGLWLADLGMAHPGAVARLHRWMDGTRDLWLAWRLVIYALLAWGFRKVWRAPGCKPEYRAPLRRMATVSVVFILVCEYAVFSAPGASL